LDRRLRIEYLSAAIEMLAIKPVSVMRSCIDAPLALQRVRDIDEGRIRRAGQRAHTRCRRGCIPHAVAEQQPGGELEQDFRLIARPDALNVLNAPSPGATASMAIGAEIIEMASQAWG
jgi:hypothetical protein